MKRYHRFVVWLGALSLGLGLGAGVAAQDGTPGNGSTIIEAPEEAFRRALYGNVDPICLRLNTIPTTDRPPALQDLVNRCNALAGSQNLLALRQVAAEEVPVQTNLSIEASNRSIGARLVAVRGGITGVNLQRFTLQVDGQPFSTTPPLTLVASLRPAAASSSTSQTDTSGLFRRLGIFINGSFAFGEKDETTNESGFDYQTYGITAGIDYRFTDSFVLGVAFNYHNTDSDLSSTETIGFGGTASGGGVDSQMFSVSVYGTFYLERFYIDGMVTLGWSEYDITRPITYAFGTESVNQMAEADTDGKQFSFSFGAGYDVEIGSLSVGPYVRLNYITIDIDGYREEINNTSDGFGWALEYEDRKSESLISVVGVQASYAISTGFGVIVPQLRGEWQHEFANNRRALVARFVADPAAAPISFVTDSPDRDYMTLGAGLSVTLPHGWSSFVDYETVLALADYAVHTFTVGVRKDL